MTNAVAFALSLASAAIVTGAVMLARKPEKPAAAGSGDTPWARQHRKGPDKIVHTDPAVLAALAGVDADLYALAAAMQSEEGTTAGRIAVGCAIINSARAAKMTILRRVAGPNGLFGQQDTGNEWCASDEPPSRQTLQLALEVRAGKYGDVTGGATQWDAPKAQDRLHAKDPAKYRTAAEVAARRQAAGAQLVMVPGVTSTRFWRSGAGDRSVA